MSSNDLSLKSIKNLIKKDSLSFFYLNSPTRMVYEKLDIVVQVEYVDDSSILVNDLYYRYKLIKSKFQKIQLFSIIKITELHCFFKEKTIELLSFENLYNFDNLLENENIIIDHPCLFDYKKIQNQNQRSILDSTKKRKQVDQEILNNDYTNNNNNDDDINNPINSNKKKIKYLNNSFNNDNNIINNNNNNHLQFNNVNNKHSNFEKHLGIYSEIFHNSIENNTDKIKQYIKSLIYNFNQLKQVLDEVKNIQTNSILKTFQIISKLLNYFKYVDYELINEKIINYLNSNDNTNNNNNNNSNNLSTSNNIINKQFKLQSIYLFSHLNKYYTNFDSFYFTPYTKYIYEKFLLKLYKQNNNLKQIDYIFRFYNKIFNKSNYESINGNIKFLQHIKYTIQINLRKERIFKYQLLNINDFEITQNVPKKIKSLVQNYLYVIKNLESQNQEPNQSIIKIYDQEVYNKLFIKPQLYCNKQLFSSDYGNNPDEVGYQNLFKFPENIYYEAPSNGNYSICPSLELFKLCFNLFSNGAFENFNLWSTNDSDDTKVIVSGGSITACLDTLPISIKKQFVNFKRIERLFYKSRMPIIVAKKFMVYVFQNSELRDLLFNRFFEPISPYFDSDVDVWIISNNLENARKKLYETIENVKSNYRSINPLFDDNHTFVRTSNAITLVQPYPYRKIQFVIRVYSSIDKLFSSFDIDCVKSYYDGSNVYMHKDTIDSFNNRYCIMDKSVNSYSRMIKYLIRGFKIFHIDFEYSNDDVEYDLKKYKDFYKRYEAKKNIYFESNQVGNMIIQENNRDSHIIYINYSKNLDFQEILEQLKKTYFTIQSYIMSISKDPVFLVETETETFCSTNAFPNEEIYYQDPYKYYPPGYLFDKLKSYGPFSQKQLKLSDFGFKIKGKCKICQNTKIDFSFEKICYECRLCKFHNLFYDSHFRKVISMKYVLILGGRNKLGNKLATTFLNYGFNVYITSRFPEITKQQILNKKLIKRYKFNISRLNIIKLDFNDQNQVDQFIKLVYKEIPKLDILINTIHLKKNNINENYHSNYQQLLLKENQLISINNEIEIHEHSPTIHDLSNLGNSSNLFNNSFILSLDFFNYLNYKLPKLIIHKLIITMDINFNNQSETDNNEISYQEILYHLYNEYLDRQIQNESNFPKKPTGKFLDTSIVYNVNDNPELDLKSTCQTKNNIIYLTFPDINNYHSDQYKVKRNSNKIKLKTKGLSSSNISSTILKEILNKYLT